MLTELKLTDNGRDNARALYELALKDAGLSPDHKEPPQEMFRRTGAFYYKAVKETDRALGELAEEHGLGDGVLGLNAMRDLANLPAQAAKRIFDVTAAMHEYDQAFGDMMDIMIAWVEKQKKEECDGRC